MTTLHAMMAHERHQDLLRAAARASLMAGARNVDGDPKPVRRRWPRRARLPAAAPRRPSSRKKSSTTTTFVVRIR